ncbi:MAG: hypothetical protein ACREOK_01695, partial [Gemmatimonadaceae bacterium]
VGGTAQFASQESYSLIQSCARARIVQLRPEECEQTVAPQEAVRRNEVHQQREALGLRKYARELTSLRIMKLDRAQNAKANHAPYG